MAFYTHQSNQFEKLIDGLAEMSRKPLRSVFVAERVVVQNNGMARWLSLQLADRLGVCAYFKFEFPAELMWDVARAVLTEMPETSAFNNPVLIWRIMALLKKLENAPEFAQIHTYLQKEKSEHDFRYYELAIQIADCFDQYLIYRPDWIDGWEQGAEGEHQDEQWQSELWRRLMRQDLMQKGQAHRIQVQRRLLSALSDKKYDPHRLPERVSIMGSSVLPPIVLDMLTGLAKVIDVHLFVLNPCCLFWADIQDIKDQHHLSGEHDPADLYLTVGNPLLAALGKQGRDFIDWMALQPFMGEWEQFVDPTGSDLLHHLQHDILYLKERDDTERLQLRPDDHSVQIHVCHSALREVEVLHDQLLALFDIRGGQPQRFRPTDVLVMTPNINTYAPLIEAVFGTAPRDRKIPFTITDRGVIAENPLIETFFLLLEGQGRFHAPQILSLLEPAAVHRRFGMDEADVSTLRHWIQEVGIRWGVDANAKTQWGLPPTPEHTWRAGLDRLLLGYALPSDGHDLYAGILPYDAVEGDEAQALGHLQSFCEALFEWEAKLREPRPWPAWIECLQAMLEAFFDPEDHDERALEALRAALEALRKHTQEAMFTESIGLEVVQSAVRHQVNADDSASGQFWGGGVTFCSMVPMRSIPFPVMGLLGMNDGVYPRQQQSVGFDLMADQFRRGDRSSRHDDRYLFLETILAARQCLYISYVGRSIHDDTIMLPSVLVSTLIYIIDRAFDASHLQDRPASTAIIVQHPLQAFSHRYFTGDARLFSYAQEWAEASGHAGRGDREATPLVCTPLPEPEAEFRTVTVAGLLQFFNHPTRWFLQERLGIQPARAEKATSSREPFVLDGLENHQLLQEMLRLHLSDQRVTKAEMEALMYSGGALPHGHVGAQVFADAQERVHRFSGRLGHLYPRRSTDTPIDLAIVSGDFRVGGHLSGVTPKGWMDYRLATMKAKDYLTVWVHHVILNVVKPEGVVLQSHFVSEDICVMLHPLDDAETHLHALLALYWRGTQEILHFFPKSALAYVEAARNTKKHTDPLFAARAVWEGDDYGQSSEADDVYYRLAFRGSDPLDANFISLAQDVFSPILSCITDNGVADDDAKSK